MILLPPENVTITIVSSISVIVSWELSKLTTVENFEIIYRPVKSRYRVIMEVPRDERSVMLPTLTPLTLYVLHMSSVLGAHRNDSSPVTFFMQPTRGSYGLTDASTQYEGPGILLVRPEEIAVVLAVFFLWVTAVILFCNRWAKIRVLEPYSESYKSPKTPCPALLKNPSCYVDEKQTQHASWWSLDRWTDRTTNQGKCKIYSGSVSRMVKIVNSLQQHRKAKSDADIASKFEIPFLVHSPSSGKTISP